MSEDPRYYVILSAVEDMDADGTLMDPDTVLDEIVRRILAALDEMDNNGHGNSGASPGPE